MSGIKSLIQRHCVVRWLVFQFRHQELNGHPVGFACLHRLWLEKEIVGRAFKHSHCGGATSLLYCFRKMLTYRDGIDPVGAFPISLYAGD